MAKIFFLIIFLIFIFSTISVKAETEIEPIWIKDKYEENVACSISGTLKGLYAVISGGNYSIFDSSNIYVALPSTQNNNLCVDIQSQDGTYKLKAAFDISGKKPGIYALKLRDSKGNGSMLDSWKNKKDILLGAVAYLPPEKCNSLEELAVDEKDVKIMLPSSWNKFNSYEDVRILMNVDKMETLRIIDLDTKKKYKLKIINSDTEKLNNYECLPLDGVTFRLECRVPLKPGPQENRIIRTLHGPIPSVIFHTHM